jgi:hypothetical protein
MRCDMKVLHDMMNELKTQDYAGRHVCKNTGRMLTHYWNGFHKVL